MLSSGTTTNTHLATMVRVDVTPPPDPPAAARRGTTKPRPPRPPRRPFPAGLLDRLPWPTTLITKRDPR